MKIAIVVIAGLLVLCCSSETDTAYVAPSDPEPEDGGWSVPSATDAKDASAD
jgi:hypothetical protein